MAVRDKIRAFRHSPKKYILTIVLAIIVIILGICAYNANGNRNKIDYANSLDKIAVTVNGQKLTLEDLAFYVVYEEHEVENEAQVYNPENTNKYWNMHIDGEFIRISARDSAMQMAIHDEIFYQMALDEGIELTDEEKEYAANTQEDFWNDLEDYGQQDNINIEREVYDEAILKIALAQKYQEIYAALQNDEKDDYNFSEDAYKQLLEKQKYKINEKVWKRVSFGTITLDYQEEN